jgi:muramoyltetrapeptide carboxypeptidase
MAIKPARLKPGDCVGLVAPASPPLDPDSIDRSVAFLKKLGFKAKLAPNVRKRLGFLAGTDRERAGDLMQMFRDKAVDAIFCLRGGYGAGRVLSLLDYKTIRANPKIFLGFSDVTALHCALLKKSELISFHGPMLSSNLIEKDLPSFTLQKLLQTLMHAVAAGSICDSRTLKKVTIVRKGRASGELVGGNLSVLATTLGTPYQPLFKGRILFLEELNETPYRVDRLLTHLLNAGVLAQVAGIAIGITKNCDETRAKKKKDRQSLEDVVKDRLRSLGIPVVTGLPFGHTNMNATLPQGARATLDAVNGDLIITEPAVR